MRILKIIGLIFGFLLSHICSAGVFVPSFEYKNSVTVNASQPSCWNAFHDASKMKTWMEGFESLTLKHGTSLQQGSVYELVMVEDGERMVMEETITDIKPGEQISYALNNDVLNSGLHLHVPDRPTIIKPIIQGRLQSDRHKSVMALHSLPIKIIYQTKRDRSNWTHSRR